MQSDQTDQIWAALAAAQAVMKNAAYDAVNPHFKNRYATLAAVIDATRQLAINGIAVTHANDIVYNIDGAHEVLVTTFGHKSGQWISSKRRVPPGLKAQEYGAWLTYNRRYALCALAGISADEDDDGNIAQAATNGKRQNPHINRPEDFAEHEVKYDTNGNPVDNIPFGDPNVEQLSASSPAAKKEFLALQAEMIALGTVAGMRKWADMRHVQNRVQSLPELGAARIRDLFEGQKKELLANEARA